MEELLLKYELENGMKLIYEKNNSSITSICIGLEAGASCEGENEVLGTAHALEHMVYKGTFTKSENEINKKLSDIFAFENAMTNYPYVIYYGSLLEQDLDQALELFSDIIINPKLSNEGFSEEMSVIKQELNEWDQDLEQYTEDRLYLNQFSGRLKYPIIGTIDSLEKMTINDLRNFYNKYYFPGNTVISIVSNIDFEKIKKIVNLHFSKWNVNKVKNINEYIENLDGKYYTDYKSGISTARVEIIFSINGLLQNQINELVIFDEYFAKGVNSILYDNLRTKKALVYDVLSDISYDKHIRLYKITFNTSKDKVKEAVLCIKNIFNNIEQYVNKLSDKEIESIVKKIKLKKLFKEEQSIIRAKNMTICEIMYNNQYIYYNDERQFNNITKDKMLKTIRMIKDKYSLQIVLPK